MFFLYSLCVLILLALGHIFGDINWWLATINSFRYYLFLPLIFFLFEIFSFKKKSYIFFFIIIILCWSSFYAPLNLIESIKNRSILKKINLTNQSIERGIKVLTFNSLITNKNTLAITSMIKEYDPDILFMQELDPTKAIAIQKLFKYKTYKDPNTISDIAIYSKYPITIISSGLTSLENLGKFQIASINLPNKRIFLVNIHTVSINPYDYFEDKDNVHRTYEKQKFLINKILKSIKNNNINPENLIIAGDFNSTEGNYIYRTLVKEAYIDAYRKINFILPIFSFTFPNSLESALNQSIQSIPFLRIDYIFSGKSFEPIKANIIFENTDSDHNPVLVEFKY